jgi:hypothetical protein
MATRDALLVAELRDNPRRLPRIKVELPTCPDDRAPAPASRNAHRGALATNAETRALAVELFFGKYKSLVNGTLLALGRLLRRNDAEWA